MSNINLQQTTSMSSATLRKTRTYRSPAQAALLAFLAMLRRDLWVTIRELVPFLVQVLIQPLLLLFIFGRVLPALRIAGPNYGGLLLPGVVALSTVMAAMQGVMVPLSVDLSFSREIDDRLLSPLPVSLIAVEKVIYATVNGLIAGAVIFPLAFVILGNGYQVRGDEIFFLIGLLVLTALAGSCLGLALGTLISPDQIGIIFAVVLTPMVFTGCTFFPWVSLQGLKWFQILTLINPLTYASEGLRAAMVPPTPGAPSYLGLEWVFLGLGVTIVVFLFIGIRTFNRRVIS